MPDIIAHHATAGQGSVACGAFARRHWSRQSHDMQLARIRKLHNLSLAALGEMIGVDASTVMRAEHMDDSAMLKTYRRCAEALGVTLADLFADDRSPVEMRLVEVFRRIPPDRHDELVDLLAVAAARVPTEAR